MLAFAAFVASSLSLVLAGPTPTAPGGSDVFTAGGNCTIQWTPDATGTWKNMNIEFMTGPNFPMIHLRTVASNIDATTQTSYSWTCPQVSLYSQVYFYQFTSQADVQGIQWTTRFTLQNSDGSAPVPPPATDAKGIPYGNGTLVDTSLYNAIPAYLVGSGELDGAKLAGATSSGSPAGLSNSASGTGSASASGSTPASPTGVIRQTVVPSASPISQSASSKVSQSPNPSGTNAASHLSSFGSSWVALGAALIGATVASF